MNEFNRNIDSPLSDDYSDLPSRLNEILDADRWVDAAYPAIAAQTKDEITSLLTGFPGQIIVLGSGSSFPEEFTPALDSVVLLTQNLEPVFDLSQSNQTLRVSGNQGIIQVRELLGAAQYHVPALCRFQAGTIGGRLASVSSRPIPGRNDGWIQNLLGLNILTPEGEEVNLGGECIKDVAGYNLLHFYTGSRGAYGVIVEAIFRCYPGNGQNINAIQPNETSLNQSDLSWKRVFDPIGRMLPGA